MSDSVDEFKKSLSSFFLKNDSEMGVQTDLAKAASLKLLEGESITKVLHPHFLAFYDMYFIWAWVILLSIAFISFGDDLAGSFNPLPYMTDYAQAVIPSANNPILENIPGYTGAMSSVSGFISPTKAFVISYGGVGLWILSLVASSIVFSVFKIEFKWVAVLAVIGLLASYTTYALALKPSTSYYFGILYSLLGIIWVEMYRRAHVFYITNFRIITEVDFLSRKRNELSYDKINNIVLDQGVVGSIFGFGTVIPVTASGLGMGADFSAVSVGGSKQEGPAMLNAQVTGGRSVQTPRARSMYSLFGVENPQDIQDILTRYLHESVNAPYLKKMTEQLEDMRGSPYMKKISDQLEELKLQKEDIVGMLEIAKKKFLMRELDEDSFKHISTETQQKLIELELRIKKVEESSGKG